MAPQFARAATALEPGMRLLKLNADAAPDLTGRLGVQGIPALLLFRGGHEVARTAGAMDAGRIAAWAQASLRAA
jgi:thioredoxin 2